MVKSLIEAIGIAEQALPEKTLRHSIRVMQIAKQMSEDRTYSDTFKIRLFISAILHDVLGESSLTIKDLPSWYADKSLFGDVSIAGTLRLLTYDKSKMNHNDYIDRIVSSGDLAALTIKAADIKDHLEQTELTPEIIEEYFPHITKFIF